MSLRMIFVSVMMIVAGLSAGALQPKPQEVSPPPSFDALLPDQFGDWTRIALGSTILPLETQLNPGEAVAYRAFRNSAGRIVTLVVVYGPPLGDSVRLHRPENCYVAQGFSINERSVDNRVINGAPAPVIRMRAASTTRQEAVSYLLRDGDAYVVRPSDHAVLKVKRGFGAPSDGALIRVSTTGADDAAFTLHSDFIDAFVSALSPPAKSIMLAAGS